MADLINTKIVISGGYAEVYYYSSGLLQGFKRKERIQEVTTNEEKRKRRYDSINRAKRNLKRIVLSNPDLNKFLTLTFKDNVKDLNEAHKEFKKFIMRLRYKRDSFKYIAVVEFQERGAVHYHILLNLKYIDNKQLANIWGHGFVKINRIDHVDNLGAYISKYLDKKFLDDRLNSRKAFFTSRDVKKPLEITDQKVCQDFVNFYQLDKEKPLKTFSFSNEYTGNVLYKIYKI